MDSDKLEQSRIVAFSKGMSMVIRDTFGAMLFDQPFQHNPQSFQISAYNAYYVVGTLNDMKADERSAIRSWYTVSLLSKKFPYPVDIVDFIYREEADEKIAGLYVRLGEAEVLVVDAVNSTKPVTDGRSLCLLFEMLFKSRPDIMDIINSASPSLGGKNASQRPGR